MDAILVVNAGSTSLKLHLVDGEETTVVEGWVDADAVGHRIVHGGERFQAGDLLRGEAQRLPLLEQPRERLPSHPSHPAPRPVLTGAGLRRLLRRGFARGRGEEILATPAEHNRHYQLQEQVESQVGSDLRPVRKRRENERQEAASACRRGRRISARPCPVRLPATPAERDRQATSCGRK